MAALVWLLASAASAHEVRPAYLSLREVTPGRYEARFRVPARGDERLALAALLPAHCRRSEASASFAGGAHTQRWRADCPGGLRGGRVGVEGLAGTFTDALVRIERADGTTQIARLDAETASFEVLDAPGVLQVGATYLRLGVDHILLGIDHLLFVLALLLLGLGRRALLATITAFTLAHSLTLAAATLGYLRVSQAPVEAVIALSIVFVAGEIIHGRQGRPGLARRRPWLVAFVFGLLHGLGFAGALREVGLPEHAIPTALLFFNLGVELGQVLFVAAALGLAALARRAGVRWPAWAAQVPAYAIGALAAYWTIQRVAAFGS